MMTSICPGPRLTGSGGVSSPPFSDALPVPSWTTVAFAPTTAEPVNCAWSFSSVTYAPVVAYRLEEKPRIDSAATKALTREELGGFAGFEPRTDVAALRKRDGSKVLWNLREHHAMP